MAGNHADAEDVAQEALVNTIQPSTSLSWDELPPGSAHCDQHGINGPAGADARPT